MGAKCYRCKNPTKNSGMKRGVLCNSCNYEAHKPSCIKRAKRWREENRSRFNESARARYLNRKLESIAAYGGSCPCGVSQVDFLTIDHVANDGAEDRRGWRGKSSDIHAWLKKRGYPPGYQVLCGNCNLKKEIQRRRSAGGKTWEHNQTAKREVLEAYGPSCTCCSESDMDKLVMDHINGGGSKEKKMYPSRNVYLFLRNKEPDRFRFQVMCQNCNQAKYSLGRCPHVEQPRPLASHDLFVGFRCERHDLQYEERRRTSACRGRIVYIRNKSCPHASGRNSP